MISPKLITIFLVSILMSSCASDLNRRVKAANNIAVANNFEQKLIQSGDFVLTTYQRINDKNLPYIFYLEGDGRSFVGRYNVSDNPTPGRPMLLKLAVLDDRPNVVYIARPCQYTPLEQSPKCQQVYWTNKRMADEIIVSINGAIETISNRQNVSLVGFSGGGGIAVLVAARNKYVKNIITIAGNLDHIAFNKYHNAGSMTGSLNPIDYAKQISHVPQLHLSGGKDKIVPSFIATSYVAKSAAKHVLQKTIKNAEHLEGWEAVWPKLLKGNLSYNKRPTALRVIVFSRSINAGSLVFT